MTSISHTLGAFSPRLDWYQASVNADPAELQRRLQELYPRGVWTQRKYACRGYARELRLHVDHELIVRLETGGIHARPHVTVVGDAAPAAAEMLRSLFPDHSVSRADMCVDYAEHGAYDLLQDCALAVARNRKIKVGTAGDHLLTKRGRTFALGATASIVQLRLYDKAQQLRGKFARDPVRLSGVPAELTRFEAQVRPQTSSAKFDAALATPLELMSAARWMRELIKLVADLELKPFAAGRRWHQSDDERTRASLLHQYGPLFRRMFEQHGSWQCVGLQIGHDLHERTKLASVAQSAARACVRSRIWLKEGFVTDVAVSPERIPPR